MGDFKIELRPSGSDATNIPPRSAASDWENTMARLQISGGELGNATTDWIDVERASPGHYNLMASSLNAGEGESLSFNQWDDGVVDHDKGFSDAASCWDHSDHLSWQEVILRPNAFEAPNLSRLQEALKHVTWTKYNNDEI